MTDTPSEAAIKEALRLMNEYETRGVVVWTEEDANLMIVRVLALRLDFEDRVVRAVAELPPTDTWRDTILRALMLPDPPDPLVEAMIECGFGDSSNAASDIRAAIEKRGGKIVWGEG